VGGDLSIADKGEGGFSDADVQSQDFSKIMVSSAQTMRLRQYRHFSYKEEWGPFMAICADIFYSSTYVKLVFEM